MRNALIIFAIDKAMSIARFCSTSKADADPLEWVGKDEGDVEEEAGVESCLRVGHGDDFVEKNAVTRR